MKRFKVQLITIVYGASCWFDSLMLFHYSKKDWFIRIKNIRSCSQISI